MKTNKIFLGGLAGAVALFLLGWLVYGILLKNFIDASYNQCATRPMDEMAWWAMILANLAMGYLIAIVLGWANNKEIMNGAKIGGIIGFLSASAMDFSTYSMTTVFTSLKPLIVDLFVATIMWALAGLVVAIVMGYSEKETKA